IELESWHALALDAGEGYSAYDTQPFRIVTLARYLAIDHLLALHRRPVVYVDSDIVFMRDPTPHFRTLHSRFRPAVLVQSDRRADLERKEWSRQYDTGARPGKSTICAGFSVWQPKRRHRRLLKTISQRILAERALPDDQTIFNEIDNELLS